MGEGFNEGGEVALVKSVEGKEKERKKERKDKNNNIIIWSRKIDCSGKIPKKYPEVENVILRDNMKSVFRNKILFSN